MLVTDAMPSVGAEVGDFILQGRAIHRDGDMLKSADGVLAGSTLTMAGAVANMIDQARVSLRQASAMAAATPAAFLGLGNVTGAIAAGLAADLVLLDDDFTVRRTWIGGVASA